MALLHWSLPFSDPWTPASPCCVVRLRQSCVLNCIALNKAWFRLITCGAQLDILNANFKTLESSRGRLRSLRYTFKVQSIIDGIRMALLIIRTCIIGITGKRKGERRSIHKRDWSRISKYFVASIEQRASPSSWRHRQFATWKLKGSRC